MSMYKAKLNAICLFEFEYSRVPLWSLDTRETDFADELILLTDKPLIYYEYLLVLCLNIIWNDFLFVFQM